MEINEKASPNLSVFSAADKKRKAGRKNLRPGDFDYIQDEDTQPIMVTEKPTNVCNKFKKFDTMRRKPVTDDTSRKPLTNDNDKEDMIG